jgi:hypothetical protein
MNPADSPPILKPKPLSARFSFGLYDLIKCRLWVLYHHKLILGITIFFSLLVPVQDWNSPAVKDASIAAKIFVFCLTAVAMLCFIVFLNIVLQVILTVTAKNKGLVGTHEIALGDHCLTEITTDNASSHRWSAYHKTGSSKNYLFLYVTDNNVIYVPKNSFSSAQAMELFVDAIRKKSGKP